MSNSSAPVIYQLKILLLTITPTIWRRVLVSSDHTIEDLHYTVQLAMGWENIHLHHFLIHGKYYGISRPGCTTFSDRAEEVGGMPGYVQNGTRHKVLLRYLQ